MKHFIPSVAASYCQMRVVAKAMLNCLAVNTATIYRIGACSGLSISEVVWGK